VEPVVDRGGWAAGDNAEARKRGEDGTDVHNRIEQILVNCPVARRSWSQSTRMSPQCE
jgi:hypothetical protein